MTTVGRHVEFTAQPGKGDELAAELTAVAEGMKGVAGCEMYAVGRVDGSPDVVAVVERWRSTELRDAAAAGASDDPRFPTIMGLLAEGVRPHVVDFELTGGVGVLPPAREGYAHRSLLDSQDMAASFGVEGLEARFPAGDLGLTRTGLAHHRLPAGGRIPFGHRHVEAEEVYVVLSGSGRARIDDEYVDLRPLDVIRVGPGAIRGFEAGDEGMDVLAVGPRTPGDGELLHDWWKD